MMALGVLTVVEAVESVALLGAEGDVLAAGCPWLLLAESFASMMSVCLKTEM